MVRFEESQTHQNLMRAFAGESQARNRYTFAASQCRARGLMVLERLFLFTAGQEKEHAELFYGRLAGMNGQHITIEGTYPVSNYADPLELLQDAQHNEMQEYAHDYRKFAQVAQQEGFLEIAALFAMIAEIEKTHSERFGEYARLVEQGELFHSAEETVWICLNCGHVHQGENAPEMCPVCMHEQGYFVRANEALLKG